MTGNDVIFTPVFRNTAYLHHVCSECGYKLKLRRIFENGPYFESPKDVRFCPYCGQPVARFSDKAIFEVALDTSPFMPFYEILRESEERARWLFWCCLADDERKSVTDLIPFMSSHGNRDAAGFVGDIARYRPSAAECKKLRHRFGSGGAP